MQEAFRVFDPTFQPVMLRWRTASTLKYMKAALGDDRLVILQVFHTSWQLVDESSNKNKFMITKPFLNITEVAKLS